MKIEKLKKRIAILGGGPSALFIYKRLVEAGRTDLEIHIFESKKVLGAGMPYSFEGANNEHVTNVSDNEIPEIVTSIEEWVQTLPDDVLAGYHIDKKRFNEYKVLPRLFFGQYLSAQFDLLLEMAQRAGLSTTVHLNRKVTDIIDMPVVSKVGVNTRETGVIQFDRVIICTGHNWPVSHEGAVPGYFDSPYPPVKLKLKLNHPVAIKGSSLTAIDAIRTLARNNGSFHKDSDGKLIFRVSDDCPEFKLMMHSRSGLLPAIRFHLEDPLLSKDSLLTEEEIAANIKKNDGFLSLDYVFKKDFKEMFREKDGRFYELIKDLSLEDFVAAMMDFRESKDPFVLFKAEYAEAEQSIKNKESIYWKEMLAVLSFAMNYPAKYLSAEDMQRLQKVLMPLISIVIAFAPQSSAEELIALHDAGKLEIIPVGDDSRVEPVSTGGAHYHYTDENNASQCVYYKTFVNCVGQPHLAYEDFPFRSLVAKGTVSPALIKFRSAESAESEMAGGNKKVVRTIAGDYYLKVPGVTINDSFQVIEQSDMPNDRIYIMAVPYIGGYNPDYSGLDFCEQASTVIIDSILNDHKEEMRFSA
jgi:hypothetical protein